MLILEIEWSSESGVYKHHKLRFEAHHCNYCN